MMANLTNINSLKDVIRSNPTVLPYANFSIIGNNCSYTGWISNFNIYKRDDINHSNPYSLDLANDNDLFLLFVLASAWSRSGQYENALYYILYFHERGIESPNSWNNKETTDERCNNRKNEADNIFNMYEDIRIGNRKEISFRSDFYSGTYKLAQNWEEIKNSLDDSEKKGDYSIFVRKIRDIGGLGGSKEDGKMSIKIPLILRELRVADRFKNIPGEWCCIPDNRVIECCNDPFFSIGLSTRGDFLVNNYNVDNGIKSILKKSEILYRLFGDLYDIPLFAYIDLHDMGLI